MASDFTPVELFELIVCLMALVIPLELLAHRLRLPPAAALLVGGMAVALLPGKHDVTLDPGLALVLFLPPLLLSSAYWTVWREFRINLRPILQLAVGAVVFTTLAVGVVTHWLMPHLPWAACFALGAIVSPPDAVAAKAVLQRLPIPPRMAVVLEGESLVNDATGLVLYRLAVTAALTGSFSVWSATGSFAVLAAGGLALGTAFGFLAVWLLARIQRPALTLVASLLASWGSYILAERAGFSGVLCTVATGLVIGIRGHTSMAAEVRTDGRAVWQVVTFVLESLVFVLIGLSLPGILERVDGGWAEIAAVMVVAAAVIVARFCYIVPVMYLRCLLPGRMGGRQPPPPWRVPVVIGWAGMRGVVSLAAALALPVAMPGRDFILLATFGVILVTVLGQGATLAPLIGWLRLGETLPTTTDYMGEAAVRAILAQLQLSEVERLSAAGSGAPRHPRLLELYRYRADSSSRHSTAEEGVAERLEEHYRVILAAVAAGRGELLRMHQAGRLHDAVMHVLEQELDSEELMARRRLGELAS